MRRIVAALILLAAAPVAAQPPSGHPAIPAELLAPNEEARASFEALASHPLTDQMIEAAIQSQPSGSTRPMDEIIERMFVAGPVVPGWQNSGVDEDAIVAALEGGPAAHMMEGANEFGPLYGYFVDRPLESIIPPEWTLIGWRGPHSLDGPAQIAVSHVSPKVILVERSLSSRHGRAVCRERTESRLYADPAVPATEADAITVIFTMRALASLEQRSLCAVVEDLGQGEYRARFFDSDGHSITVFDRGSPRFRIVPFRPVPRRAAAQ